MVEKRLDLYKNCTLCPRACRVDRTKGQLGYCRLPANLVLDCTLAHFGEEPPLSGTRGAGTIFFSSCNLRCLFCQNYQISHTSRGHLITTEELAAVMLDLQKQGCHNIEPVTPTPQTPLIMEALHLARAQGLRVPFVYNCGGYENPDIIRMLNGRVDIYLPDFKYGLMQDALEYSDAPRYPDMALASLREMVRQVGDDLDVENGVAVRGLIVRHLVLPGCLENSKAVLRLLHREISTTLPLSLMSQYTPIPQVQSHPLLKRRITADEYNEILDYALGLGFENLFVQDVNDQALTPDFDREKPFD